jgi:hypothetical protein
MERYEDFRKGKLKIGRMDLRIACVVLELSAILVTADNRAHGEYARTVTPSTPSASEASSPRTALQNQD